MLLPDTSLHFKSKKEHPYLSTSLFSMVLPFAKIQYFLFDKYLTFAIIPIPSTVEFQLFKPHPIPIYLDISIQEPYLLKKVLLLQQKEDMSLSIFENHVFILTKYENIQKFIPSIFISSAHKLTLALIIITLLMITSLGLILLKIQKISKKINKKPIRIEHVQKTPLSLVTKLLLTDLTFNIQVFLYSITPFFSYRIKVTLDIF